MPVVVHAGHAPVGTEHTGPGPFGSLLARHPGLTAVVAHMGAPDYQAFLQLAADHERVALDTTMIFTDFFDKMAPFPAAALPLARELGLAGKILLGSDSPNIPYPYARQIAGLARLGLGDAWLAPCAGRTRWPYSGPPSAGRSDHAQAERPRGAAIDPVRGARWWLFRGQGQDPAPRFLEPRCARASGHCAPSSSTSQHRGSRPRNAACSWTESAAAS